MAENTRTYTVRLKIDGKEIPNSVDDLAKSQRSLKKELRGLEQGTEAYIKKSQQLNQVSKRLNEVRTDINDVGKEWKKQTAAFKAGVSERVNGLQIYGVSIGSVTDNFGSLSKMVGGSTKAFKLLKIAIASTGIGLLLTAFASLATYLTKTQKGMDLVSRVFGVFSAVVDTVLGRIAKLGNAILKLFQGDFQGALDEASSAFENIGQAIAETAEKRNDLEKLIVSTRKLNREAQNTISTYERQIEVFNALADDATRSFKEREDAASAARALEVRASQERVQIAQRDFNIVNQQLKQAEESGTATAELRDRQADSLRNLMEAQKSEQLLFLEGEKRKRELIQDRLERDLDILIDGFDNQKTVNEAIINNEKKTFEERNNLLQETKRLAEDSFKAQISTIQEFTDIQINANDLLATSNAVLLNQKIRELGLSEIIEGRLLEIVRERRVVEKDFTELSTTLSEQRIKNENEERANYILNTSQKAQITDEYTEIRKRQIQAELALQQRVAEAMSSSIVYAIEASESAADFAKNFANAMRKAVSAALGVTIAEAIKDSFVSSGNPLVGLALAPIAAAGAQAIFNSAVPSFYYGGSTGKGNLGFGDQYGPYAGFVHQDEFVLSKGMLNDPYVANVTRYIEDSQKYGSARPQSTSVTADVSLDAKEMKEASMIMLQAANVLRETRLKAEFSRRSFEDAQEDYNEKETARNRGAL